MKQNGFLLLTFTVYLFCCSVLLLSALPIIVSLSIFLVHTVQRETTLRMLYTTHARLTRDITQISPGSCIIQKRNTTIIFEKEKNIFIEWIYDETEQTLYRNEGMYNIQRDTWKNKQSALIARNIALSIKKNETEHQVHTVYCSLMTSTENAPIEWMIFPCGGVYQLQSGEKE